MQITNKVIDFTVVMLPGEANEGGPVWVDFWVYDITGWTTDFVKPLYELKNTVGGANTERLDEAQVFCHGRIKWDGCCDLYFDEQDNAEIHGCGRKDMTRIGALMDVLYNLATDLMPTREEELA